MARVRVLSETQRLPGRTVTLAAQDLAARLPRLVLEARRVAGTLAHGIHGRRRAGPGETFWQFRPFSSGEPASRIDWRRSGRDDRLYVREREWEAAHSVHLWIDRSASMAFGSELAMAPKCDRAVVLGLALAESFVEAGERVGMMGQAPPRAVRRIAERFAEILADPRGSDATDMPPPTALAPHDEAVILSDCLSPAEEWEACIAAIAARGARGHVMMIVDPVEESFPFAGQAMLEDPEGGLRLRVGDAASWGAQYRTRIARHRDALEAATRRRGWTLTIHRTDRPASEAALRLMALVQAARSGMGGR
ncbi:MAG: hypothetical protein HLUCCO17_03830 [Saliniramus fredricksonii]|uniref:DUF58 domain-containing protein n=1 Tax=Saliniramus fredricksonii TaxID=1653334 RepID=A0A0P7Y518_9HYPH|nr:DUF58 domain-containing protein [Saliniramus fredricksonii]KPQ11933.1 MAG: hypothetical protein HLUCCO17_03830 [Saliniramus fredricksonii]SCC81571.1 Protein of unknown function DUF58 [Saliniramus fredricksonii]